MMKQDDKGVMVTATARNDDKSGTTYIDWENERMK